MSHHSFRRIALLAALAAALFAFLHGPTSGPANGPATAGHYVLSAQAPTVRVLTNFTLIDGRGGPATPGSALIITDGRISWIGSAAQVKAPPGAAAENLSGRFVMPGLINLHSHVAESDGVIQDPVKFFTREEVERDLRLFASYGVTTVASLGTDQPLVYTIREEQRRGRPAMARIFTAGRGFTVKDGFPTNKGNVPGVPYEPVRPSDVGPQVEELAGHKPDVVKIWVDDRFGDFKKTPIEISQPIIEGAHKHKLKVIAHIFYLDDAKQLARAGLDAFGHSVRDKAVDDELIGLMKQHGTWVIPTLFREAATFAFADPDRFLKDPFFTRGVSPRMQAVLKSPEYQKALTGDKYFPNYPGYLKTAQENLKRLADAGVNIGFGSDTGVLTRFEGFGEHWELELMVQSGLTPAQAITAATRRSAEFLGQQRDLGTLELGKWADLMVLSGNPLTDIRNTRKIETVYVAGNRLAP
jgi:imidazolonepropionase-like amidohydrolase